MLTPKETLKRYLHSQREVLLWKTEGLQERDLRWPHTVTGTNLLGMVKHVGSIQYEYFGPVFGRRVPEPMPWLDEGSEDNADMWATAEESKDWILGFFRRSGEFADRTIDEMDLDDSGNVPWWGPEADTTLHRVLVHVIAEMARHAGQADIIRETIDGAAGLRPGTTNLPHQDSAWWAAYVDRLRQAAETAGGSRHDG